MNFFSVKNDKKKRIAISNWIWQDSIFHRGERRLMKYYPYDRKRASNIHFSSSIMQRVLIKVPSSLIGMKHFHSAGVKSSPKFF